jgi:hypothetical protein
MNDLEKRIKLAKAMGFPGDHYTIILSDGAPKFNPFTDANDDYAVLEWMRDVDGSPLTDEQWGQFVMTVPSLDEYIVGDIARAALEVIKND